MKIVILEPLYAILHNTFENVFIYFTDKHSAFTTLVKYCIILSSALLHVRDGSTDVQVSSPYQEEVESPGVRK